ncbi:MAG: wax ester/triacylglycerol synthase family O-acyltransferase [Solirubrobacterales bacterium]|nr:wax ester/triacylglycerol synthase family O-acyltransferase [Solirubrobacterales bacterium]
MYAAYERCWANPDRLSLAAALAPCNIVSMPPRLSFLDGSFLRVETPSAHMHVGWKATFRPRLGRAPITVDAVRALVAARIRLAPRFRERLAFPPAGMAEPVWVDDERFDLAFHVRGLGEAQLPLTPARFGTLADRVLSEPLDRTRALWRLHFAPELTDGTIGMVMKIHHAMVDGKSAVELGLLLLDLDPEAPASATEDDWRPARAPRAARMAVDAVVERGAESLRMARDVARAATSPRLAGTLSRATLSLSEDLLRPAPASYVNVPIGPQRTLLGHVAPLAPLLAAKTEHGVTLNDVALACVAGALRQLALSQGSLPRPLKVMVPVSVRSAEEAASLGNQISMTFIDLPVHLRDPIARLEATHEATTTFKRDGRAAGGTAVIAALGLLPSPLKTRAATLAASERVYNLTVSNIPGPRVPVYLLGAELLEAFPVVPIADGHALSIGMFSYRDRLCFGGYADPVALPVARQLPGALNASILELTSRRPTRRLRAIAGALA